MSEHPKCAVCGAPATCFGRYDSDVEEHACDECCGHGNEDGHCRQLFEPLEVGEEIKRGDEWFYAGLGVWMTVGRKEAGNIVPEGEKYRRPIAEPTCKEGLQVEPGSETPMPPSIGNPAHSNMCEGCNDPATRCDNEGTPLCDACAKSHEDDYRPLKAGEIVRETDFDYFEGVYEQTAYTGHIVTKEQEDLKMFIREVEEPVVKDSLTADHVPDAGEMVATPRTDDECFDIRDIGENGGVEQDEQLVRAHFARQLERELTKTIARREVLHGRLLECVNEIEKAEKERDEWRTKAESLHDGLKEAQWGYLNEMCPACGNGQKAGHRADCWIRTELAAYELKAKEGM